jgi:hypothetical protein
MAGPGQFNELCLGQGRGPQTGTGTDRSRQARNDPYRDTKRPMYPLKTYLISHFLYLIKNTNLEMMLVTYFLQLSIIV